MLWHQDNFIEKLQHNILHALPGIDAQLQMAPPLILNQEKRKRAKSSLR
jgi:hypothetical protein